MAAQEVPIPFSEPPWILGLPSPYYNESHLQWQKDCREWLKERFTNHALEWEEEGTVPEHVFKEFFSENMLIPYMPAPLPVETLKSVGIHKILNLKVEDFDYTHFAIYVSEMKRSGIGGPASSLNAGVAYGIPPILKYGSKQLQDRFLPALLKGEKRICLAITEPSAGSDVANIATTAEKSADGKYYILNGNKKWITNGIWSHYATMAVRTGGPGPTGLSMMVVPLLDYPGVTMRRLKTGGAVSSGTTFIELDDVKVPVENLIGQEGMGMRYIMTNFNHERLTICVGTTRTARVALAAAFEYVMKREAFGKPLIDQPVVRHRLAKCGAEVESLDAWVQQFVVCFEIVALFYSMCLIAENYG
jgi:acyl-CoA dehydrogenase